MALWDFIRKPRKVGRPTKEPTRETQQWPNLTLLGQNISTQAQRIVYKSTPRNLRYFSETPIARRAINAIRNPLAQMEWEIVPNKEVSLSGEIKKQIEIVTTTLSLPNDDDSFNTLLMMLINDICCGAGVLEIGITGYRDRPVYLWGVDGLSVHMYPGWAGGKNEARYLQTIGYGGSYSVGFQPGIKLRDDEIVYIKPNPTTSSPYGFGPLEVAFNSIANQLATAKFAAKLAGNALPPFIIDLGEVTSRVIQTWRSYWSNDIEGEGKVPIIGTELVDGQAGAGKTRGLNVQKLYPEGDKALYLQYQEFLRTEIAAAFDISNLSLNIERDLNRSTAEVVEDREWTHAVRPMAQSIASGINRKIIWDTLGFSGVHFAWKAIAREDSEKTSTINQRYYVTNVKTPNEIRKEIGLPPSKSVWADLHKVDVDIATVAARGVGVIDDPDLSSDGTRPPVKPVAPSKPKIAASSDEEDI